MARVAHAANSAARARIARIGQEVTLKCFRRADPDRSELQPRSSNP